MAVLINKGFKERFLGLAPLILLYFLCITETDTKFTNHFEILSFELQLIIIYYWKLKNPSLLGNGHIFLAGIINDVITGLPMCTSIQLLSGLKNVEFQCSSGAASVLRVDV